MGLMIGIYNGGELLDVSRRARNVQCSTNQHGFQAMSFEFSAPLDEAFRLYDRSGIPSVLFTDGVQTIWTGRVEDITLIDGGVRVQAFGYWRAYSDVPYTALWSSTSVADWQPFLTTENSSLNPDMWNLDTNNRLFLSPKKNSLQSVATIGGLRYVLPSGSSRTLQTISFDYVLFAPVGWQALINTYSAAWASIGSAFSLAATGAVQSGTYSNTLGGVTNLAALLYYNNATPAAVTAEDGTYYFRITNLRLKTTVSSTVDSDEIAKALVAQVANDNPAMTIGSTVLIQSPGIDLRDEVYEDELPADILTRLAALGDSNGEPWEVGVWEGQNLFFRPQLSVFRSWAVEVGSLEVERTIETLRNSMYVIYKDASGNELRTSNAANTASVDRWGVKRRGNVSLDTTSGTEATTVRTTVLADTSNPQPRARVTITRLFTADGVPAPLWQVRAGDMVTIRGLPPTLSSDIGRIRTFRIAETTYNADDDTLDIVPEAPLPTLDVLLARRAEGI